MSKVPDLFQHLYDAEDMTVAEVKKAIKDEAYRIEHQDAKDKKEAARLEGTLRYYEKAAHAARKHHGALGREAAKALGKLCDHLEAELTAQYPEWREWKRSEEAYLRSR